MTKLSRTKKTYKLVFSYKENKKTKEFSYTYASNKPLYEANDPAVVDQIYIVKKGNEILQVDPVSQSIKHHMDVSIGVLNMQKSPTSFQKWIRDFLEEEITIIVYTFKNLPIKDGKYFAILRIIAGKIVFYHRNETEQWPLYQREIPCYNDAPKDKKYIKEAKKIYNEIKEKGDKMDEEELKIILKKLSESRPVFHSEADFQHSLAIEIKGKYPEAKVRLEVPFEGNTDEDTSGKKKHSRNATDLVVTIGKNIYPIELKYKTKKLENEIKGEQFSLIEQGALNLNSHALFKDIKRIEDFERKEKGFVIMITNNPSYFKDFDEEKFQTDKAGYKNFKLYNNRKISREHLIWKNDGKCKKYGNLTIKGNYTLNWIDYSSLQNKKEPHNFKYLLLEIKKKGFK